MDYISLFSGAMGLDIGLEHAGFKPIVCNEIDAASVKTIHLNRPKLPVIDFSIEDVDLEVLNEFTGKDVKEIPLVAGGPPCQAFSVFGKRGGITDERGMMVYEFIRIIDEVRPKAFIMENVRGLHSMPIIPKSKMKTDSSIPIHKTEKGSLLKQILTRFEKIGYRVDCFLVNSINYGAPQNRERIICIGNRFNLMSNFPEPQYSNRPEDKLPPFKTLGDAIGKGFVDPDPEVMNFSERKLKYLSLIPPGGNWRSMPVEIQKESMGKSWGLKGGRSAYWRKLSFDYPSPTVVTMPNHAGTSMCHPKELRALSVGELASIQEFPKNWKFAGKTTQKCKQIGNAVPMRLGKVAGEVVMDLLQRIDKLKTGNSKSKFLPSRIQHIRSHVRTRTYWKNGKVSTSSSYYKKDTDDKQQLPLFANLH